jgi:DNA-binding HxlR family transcriptional regulator/putative sterol carrier protein
VGRRYCQYCPVARALDVAGDRWTLLVARELLLGPRRFTDLADGLPGIGSSVLSERLKELEGHGLVAKRTLPPPAASVVYELTDQARGLARVLAALADWGMSLLGQPGPDDTVDPRWLVLALAVTATPPKSLRDATYELRVDDQAFHIRSDHDRLRVAEGPAASANATITMTTDTLAAIASGDLDITSPRADRLIAVDGDATAARQLLESVAQIRVSTDTSD